MIEYKMDVADFEINYPKDFVILLDIFGIPIILKEMRMDKIDDLNLILNSRIFSAL